MEMSAGEADHKEASAGTRDALRTPVSKEGRAETLPPIVIMEGEM